MSDEKDIEQAFDEAEALVERKGEEEFELEAFLSTDGKHTIRIKATTKAGKTLGMREANRLFDEILAKYGSKAKMWEGAMSPARGATQTAIVDGSKTCSEHNEPMILSKKGKWYHKNNTGEFCFNNNQGWIKFGKNYGS